MDDIEYYNRFLHKQKFIVGISHTIFTFRELVITNNVPYVIITWIDDDDEEQELKYSLANTISYIKDNDWLTLSYLRKEKLKKLKND